GDLHKLWRARRPGSYHVEYGYSTMGYEIAGALGVKLAAPQREVFAIVGDGSYLMLSSEIATAVQEGVKLIVVLIDNRGFASIGALSRSLGTDGFGTRYRRSVEGGVSLDSDLEDERLDLPIDLAANAQSLGAEVIRAQGIDDLPEALSRAREASGVVVVHVIADRRVETPSYESWWEVPVAEVSERAEVRDARAVYLKERERQRTHLRPPGGSDE
ncbi:MAG TPA: thiamine pyrophosphate-dependent enzyme, partial [Solirubrobacteraceae bacterium]|nr:thiamine pyrophosphate-dependent enzyme [Solirubrobacteraceae bacterium]